MAPGRSLQPRLPLRVRLNRRARPDLGVVTTVADRLLNDRAGPLGARDCGRDVLGAADGEVAHGNLRHTLWVGVAQSDRASCIATVGLEAHPGECAEAIAECSVCCPAWVVA